MAVKEAEQQRLHRELHDGLGPVLTGAAYRADAAANLIVSDPDESQKLLEQVKGGLREAIDSVRQVVQGMRPLDLDAHGLHAALTRRASNLMDETGTQIHVELFPHGALENLPPASELAAYRKVAEALTNIARHSTATHTTVRVSLDGDVDILVVNNGQGG